MTILALITRFHHLPSSMSEKIRTIIGDAMGIL